MPQCLILSLPFPATALGYSEVLSPNNKLLVKFLIAKSYSKISTYFLV